MRSSALFTGLATLLLAGCATLNEADRDVLRQHRVSPALYAKMTHREQLSLPDIMELAERRVPAPFTVHYLRSTVAVYRLKSDDVVLLRKSGVTPQVIDYMLTTPTLYSPLNDPFWYGDDPFWYDYPPPGVVRRSHFDHHDHHDHHHRRH
jgi:hypothetical protein